MAAMDIPIAAIARIGDTEIAIATLRAHARCIGKNYVEPATLRMIVNR